MKKIISNIIYSLDEYGRRNLSRVSRDIHTSQQRVSYNIVQLEKKKIIDFTTLFDYAKFNLNGYLVLFQILYHNLSEHQKIISFLKEQDEIVWLETLDGKYDLLLFFLTPNPSSFNKTLKEILSKYPDTIKNYSLTTTIVQYNFQRSYLNNKLREKKFRIIGGDREPLKLDEKEKKICQILHEDPRIKMVEISKKIKISATTVLKYLKRLRKKQIIINFKPILKDLSELGVINKKIFIKYHNFDINLEDKLISFCKQHPNITGIIKGFGSWDLIINLEFLKEKEFNKFLIEFREGFEKLIDDFEIININKIEKHNYLPSNYL